MALAETALAGRHEVTISRFPRFFFPRANALIPAYWGWLAISRKSSEIIDTAGAASLGLSHPLHGFLLLPTFVVIQEFEFAEYVLLVFAGRDIQKHGIPAVEIDAADIPSLAEMQLEFLAVGIVSADVTSDKPLVPVTGDIPDLTAGVPAV